MAKKPKPEGPPPDPNPFPPVTREEAKVINLADHARQTTINKILSRGEKEDKKAE